MADNKKRVTTDHKLMASVGCSPCSSGCANCWAAQELSQDARRGSALAQQLVTIDRKGIARLTGEVILQPHLLHSTDKMRGKNIWVSPRSDPFHEKIPTSYIAETHAVAARNPQNCYQFLTKRIERMQVLYNDSHFREEIEEYAGKFITWPLPNTWAGTTVENEKVAEERISLLLSTPSVHRYISFQPLLEYVNVVKHLKGRAKDIRLAILGGEAGVGSRPFNRTALAETRFELTQLGVPCFSQCYPL